MSGDLFGFVEIAYRLTVCIHVFMYPPPPTPRRLLGHGVCVRTVAPSRSHAPPCTRHAASVYLCSPTVLYIFSVFWGFFSTVPSSPSPKAARHTNTRSTRRYTSTRAFMRTLTLKYALTYYSSCCTQGRLTDTYYLPEAWQSQEAAHSWKV